MSDYIDPDIVPLYPDDDSWSVAEVIAVLAVVGIGPEVSTRILRILRGLHRMG